MANKLTPPPPTGNGLLDRWLALLYQNLTAAGQFVRAQISDFAHDHTADADGGALTNDLHDGYIEVATSATPGTPDAGKMRIYAQDAGGVARLRAVHSSGSDLAFFRDAVVRVKNTSGGTINKGEVAYITGATGNFPTIAKAKADAAATMPAAGMVLATALDNAFTTLQFSGEMTMLDTSAFAEGARVFVSATTAGAITATEPQHPNLSQAVGVITKANAGDGRIQLFVSLQHEGDDYGSNRNTFSIGDGGAGAKVLAFVNAFIGSLSWQPTATRTLTLPDETGTIATRNANTFGDAQLIDVNSTSNALEIRQIGTGNALVIEDSTNPDSTPLVVDASGALMLGVTSAIAADAASPNLFPRLSVHSISSAAAISLCSWINAIGNAANYTLGKSRGASIGTNAAVNNGDSLGLFRFAGDDGAGFRIAATVSAFADGAVSSGVVPGRLVFSTADSLGVMTEHTRLNSSGQFSVGRSAISGPALSATVAAKFTSVNATYTDSATTASGTVAHGTINSFDNPTVAASNTSVTYTNLSTVYIDGAPTAGTNVTITNPYALYVAAGAVYLGDGLSTAGNATLGDANTDAHKVNGTLELQDYTVATLPAAGTRGRTAYVTDATAPTYLGALTGGGAVVCKVFDNGAAWVSC